MLVSSITSRADAVEPQCSFVAPASHAADADLQEISYLTYGEHPVELSVFCSLPHDSPLSNLTSLPTVKSQTAL